MADLANLSKLKIVLEMLFFYLPGETNVYTSNYGGYATGDDPL